MKLLKNQITEEDFVDNQSNNSKTSTLLKRKRGRPKKLNKFSKKKTLNTLNPLKEKNSYRDFITDKSNINVISNISNFVNFKKENKNIENINISKNNDSNFNMNKNPNLQIQFYTPKKSFETYKNNSTFEIIDKNNGIDNILLYKNLFLTENLFSKNLIKMSNNFNNRNNSKDFDKIYNEIFCSVKKFTESSDGGIFKREIFADNNNNFNLLDKDENEDLQELNSLQITNFKKTLNLPQKNSKDNTSNKIINIENSSPSFDDWYINFYNLNEEEISSSYDESKQNNFSPKKEKIDLNENNDLMIHIESHNKENFSNYINFSKKTQKELKEENNFNYSNFRNLNNLFTSFNKPYDFLSNKFSLFSKNYSLFSSEVKKFSSDVNNFNLDNNTHKEIFENIYNQSSENLKNNDYQYFNNENKNIYFNCENVGISFEDENTGKIETPSKENSLNSQNFNGNEKNIRSKNIINESETNCKRFSLKRILNAKFNNNKKDKKIQNEAINQIIDELAQFFPEKEELELKENSEKKKIIMEFFDNLFGDYNNEFQNSSLYKNVKGNFLINFFLNLDLEKIRNLDFDKISSPKEFLKELFEKKNIKNIFENENTPRQFIENFVEENNEKKYIINKDYLNLKNDYNNYVEAKKNLLFEIKSKIEKPTVNILSCNNSYNNDEIDNNLLDDSCNSKLNVNRHFDSNLKNLFINKKKSHYNDEDKNKIFSIFISDNNEPNNKNNQDFNSINDNRIKDLISNLHPLENLYDKTTKEDLVNKIFSLSYQKKQTRNKKYKMFSPQDKKFCLNLLQIFSFSEVAKYCNIPIKSLKRWSRVGAERQKGGGRKTRDPLMEIKLLHWINTKIENGKHLTQGKIREKALKLTTNPEFLASKGWFVKFQYKYNIKIHKKKNKNSLIKQNNFKDENLLHILKDNLDNRKTKVISEKDNFYNTSKFDYCNKKISLENSSTDKYAFKGIFQVRKEN